MEEKTGKSVQFFPVQSNAAQIEAMRAGRLHIAGFNTGSNPLAVACAGLRPFAMMASADDSFGYEMEIITYPDSGITKVEDIKGNKLAFTAETSNSGFKAPSVWLVRPLALLLIVSSRSINSLIRALLLVAIIDPGIVAIGLRSIGFIAKLLYEAIEEIDRSQVEAVTATGASGAQMLDYAIVPQILPTFFGISVFRRDINIRESAILGLVGAGGIGLQLQASLNTLAWPQVTLIFVVILATVVVSEWVSAKVRAAIT